MTNLEMIENNSLIARFMGADKLQKIGDSHYEILNTNYHSSWNLLMPVVLKINTIDNFAYSVDIYPCMVCILGDMKHGIYNFDYCAASDSPDGLITILYEAIVEFLKYYLKC